MIGLFKNKSFYVNDKLKAAIAAISILETQQGIKSIRDDRLEMAQGEAYVRLIVNEPRLGVALVTLSSYSLTYKHVHSTDVAEYIVVINGQMEVSVFDKKNENQLKSCKIVKAGCMVYIPPNTPHITRTFDSETEVMAITIPRDKTFVTYNG